MGTVTLNILSVFGALVFLYTCVVLYRAIKISLKLRNLEKEHGITIIDTYIIGRVSVALIYDPNIDRVYEILIDGSPTAVRQYHEQKGDGDNVYDSFIDTLFE